MAEFKRSRLARRNEETVTKKTVFMGFLTILVIILVILFGLPLLVKFSVFLGNTKKNDNLEEKAVPPLAPRLVLPYEATNSATISINGFSESGVEVELYKNEISIGKTQVTENGDFVFKDISLEEGDNSFSAIANSKNAGSSDGSVPMVISYDNKIPELKLTNPTEKELTVDYADFDIVGETEKGANVTINGKLAVVDDTGKFKLKIQLNMGKNELEVVARDIAGNESKSKITITYSL
jgi:bacillopeptidase F